MLKLIPNDLERHSWAIREASAWWYLLNSCIQFFLETSSTGLQSYKSTDDFHAWATWRLVFPFLKEPSSKESYRFPTFLWLWEKYAISLGLNFFIHAFSVWSFSKHSQTLLIHYAQSIGEQKSLASVTPSQQRQLQSSRVSLLWVTGLSPWLTHSGQESVML